MTLNNDVNKVKNMLGEIEQIVARDIWDRIGGHVNAVRSTLLDCNHEDGWVGNCLWCFLHHMDSHVACLESYNKCHFCRIKGDLTEAENDKRKERLSNNE